MKKIFNIALAGVLVLLSASSCEDYLEAPAKSTLDESQDIFGLCSCQGCRRRNQRTNGPDEFIPWTILTLVWNEYGYRVE